MVYLLSSNDSGVLNALLFFVIGFGGVICFFFFWSVFWFFWHGHYFFKEFREHLKNVDSKSEIND